MIRDPVFVGAHSVARDSISKGCTLQFTNVSRDINIDGGRNFVFLLASVVICSRCHKPTRERQMGERWSLRFAHWLIITIGPERNPRHLTEQSILEISVRDPH